jgi:hypothetical protein
MPNKKINQLDTRTGVALTDLILIGDPTSGTSFKLTATAFRTLLNNVPYTGATTNVNLGAFNLTAASIIRTGGTSSQFLKADGSVDSSVYITGITSGNVTTALGYTPVTNARTLTINGTTFDLSANRSWTIAAGITGSGVANQLTYWNGTGSVTGSAGLTFASNNLGYGGNGTVQHYLFSTNSSTPVTQIKNSSGSVILSLTDGGFLGLGGNFSASSLLHLRGSGPALTVDITTSASVGAINFLNSSGALVGQVTGSGATFSNGIYTGNQVAVSSYENNGKTTIVAGGTSGFINFATGGILAGNERMRLTSAGRLLLGTTTEGTFILDVVSDARINGVTVGEGGGSLASNTVLGANALNLNSIGANNVAVGFNALSKNTASNNVGIGHTALTNQTSGSSNVGIGSAAMTALTTGASNIGIGVLVLNAITTQSNNVAIGDQAMSSATTSGSVAIGRDALKLTTTTGNVAIGESSLTSTTSGANNTSVGRLSMQSNTTGGNNTSIGNASFFANTTGSNNVAIGVESARFISGGVTTSTIQNQSVFIGDSTRPLANNQTNQIVIGYQSTGLGSNTTVIGNSSTTDTAIYGRMLVNYSTPVIGTFALDVNGTARVSGAMIINGSTGAAQGSIYSDGSNGLVLLGKTGSTYDLSLTDASFNIRIGVKGNVISILGTLTTTIAANFNGLSVGGSASSKGVCATSNTGTTIVGDTAATLFSASIGSGNGTDGLWMTSNGKTNIGRFDATYNASAVLEVSSTTKGFRPPVMTTTQKNAISSPAAGLQVYDSTLNQMSYYNGTTWINF